MIYSDSLARVRPDHACRINTAVTSTLYHIGRFLVDIRASTTPSNQITLLDP
jgi:hypothetical protein